MFLSLKCLINLLLLLSPELGGLLKFVRPFLISISKAKAARLVRSLLDLFLDMEAATGQEVELCLECIEWAKAEKRTFLRQALEARTDVITLSPGSSPPINCLTFDTSLADEAERKSCFGLSLADDPTQS